jgi:hypothetical protein
MESTAKWFYPWLEGEIICEVIGRVVAKSTTATGEVRAIRSAIETYYSRAKPTCCNMSHNIPLSKLQSFIEYTKSTQEGLWKPTSYPEYLSIGNHVHRPQPSPLAIAPRYCTLSEAQIASARCP